MDFGYICHSDFDLSLIKGSIVTLKSAPDLNIVFLRDSLNWRFFQI